MRHLSYRIILSAMGIMLLCNLSGWPEGDFAMAGLSNAVQVQYASGDTELDTIAKGVNFFSSVDSAVDKFPAELANLQFTRRAFPDAVDATIDAPSESTVYVVLGQGPAADDSRQTLESGGWKNIGYLYTLGSDARKMGVYKQTFTSSQHLVVPSHKGAIGVIVAAAETERINPSAE